MGKRENINKKIISDTLLEMSNFGGRIPSEYNCYDIANGRYQMRSLFGWIKYKIQKRKKYKIIIK